MEIDMLLSGAETIIGQEELLERFPLEKAKVKFGVDPTRPDLTFGHLVVLKAQAISKRWTWGNSLDWWLHCKNWWP